MVLENYVSLQPGVPALLHFRDHRIETRTVTDNKTGLPTTRKTLVFDVDRVNGKPVIAMYSIMADTHANQFAAYLDTKSYLNFYFTITKNGEGFMTRWTLQATPRGV
jgi:hypothetical protein